MNLKNIFDVLDEMTDKIQTDFVLTLNRSPNKISFETADALLCLEDSWLLDTYDFFITDFEGQEFESESGVEAKDLPRIFTIIKEHLTKKTTNLEGLLLKIQKIGQQR